MKAKAFSLLSRIVQREVSHNIHLNWERQIYTYSCSVRQNKRLLRDRLIVVEEKGVSKWVRQDWSLLLPQCEIQSLY